MIHKIVRKIQQTVLPTEHDKELNRWWADDGDDTLRLDYDIDSESIVLDLGGYKGQWASDIYSKYNCRVLIFEPVKSFATKIEKRFEKNSKIEVFKFALGETQRHETIALSNDGSSIWNDGPVKEEIEFQDVLSFFDNKNIENVDLMKVNIEGGEYELFPRLIKTGLIDRIENIQIQFHKIVPDSEKSMEEILTALEKTHSPTYQYKFVWENWKRRIGGK